MITRRGLLGMAAGAMVVPKALSEESRHPVDVLKSLIGRGGVRDSGSVTVTPAGGTPAYTYAWTWLSGGSGITIGSASSAMKRWRETAAISRSR